MKIAIVGWGVEGQSAYRYFGPEHEYLIVNEEPRDDFPPQSDKVRVQFVNAPREPGLTGNVADTSYLQGIDSYDKVIYTPTSRKVLEKLYPENSPFWQKATTDRHIFFETVKTENIIGITGSKGKGTTSTLIAKLLEAQGKKVFIGGNIGNSVLDFVKDVEPDDWVVLELANFQLYKFPYSPHIAVCLMITEEHLDWHTDIEEYIEAKANLFEHQKTDDIAIYLATNEYSKSIAGFSPGKQVPFFEAPGAYVREDGVIMLDKTEVMDRSEVRLLGEHNLENVCAALTAVFEATGSLDKAKAVLSSFSGLEHRLEFVRTFEGADYYDDSFATTPEAAIVAIKAFDQPKIIILGGHDKGLDFAPLADEVAKNDVKQVIVIGQTADQISLLLKQRGYKHITSGLTNMAEIVAAARAAAQPGDAILLSTGCASFGMFKDYKDRGDQFKKSVKALA